MDRRELKIAIAKFIGSIPEEERFCDGCVELKTKKTVGARGQVMTAFGNGAHRCDVWGVAWEYVPGKKADRPLECLLNGEKYNV